MLFIALLRALRNGYRGARRIAPIVLVVDNYIIHKTRQTRRWMDRHSKVELRFQPACHPWVRRIQRLWRQLHETVTRNQRHASIRTPSR